MQYYNGDGPADYMGEAIRDAATIYERENNGSAMPLKTVEAVFLSYRADDDQWLRAVNWQKAQGPATARGEFSISHRQEVPNIDKKCHGSMTLAVIKT